MKRFMKMFEDIMVAVAFAEEGVSIEFLRQRTDLHKELGDQTWELL